MSKRIYNFQDILYVKYDDTDDTLSIDMTEEYKKENAPYDLLNAVAVYNEIGGVVQKGYVYNKENLITYTTGFIFRNFKQTVEDAIDNESGWSMALLGKKFETLPLSKFTSLIQISSEGFFLDSTYKVIQCLYVLCDGLKVPLVTESGFELLMYAKNS